MNKSAEGAVTIADEGNAQASLLNQFLQARDFSRTIAAPLSAEDCAIQSMEDASPIRWHLAHTTWFFETFVLKQRAGYRAFDESFEYLFNSYYNSVGQQFPRSQRGLISRPGLQQTLEYREFVGGKIAGLLKAGNLTPEEMSVIVTGINHEQQHQELMLTDVKHALSINPLDPVYQPSDLGQEASVAADLSWVEFDETIAGMGYDGVGFCFDNETPRHRVFLEPFRLANRCVTNGEYLQFMEDGGYRRPEYWLSLGWATVQEEGWKAPLYWRGEGNDWTSFTLGGRREIATNEPVTHLSYFEADAYARWAGCRLATEAEWEYAVTASIDTPMSVSQSGVWSDELMSDGRVIHPLVQGDFAGTPESFSGAMGNVWEWTSSHYSAFPGYVAPEGALGEYNGKFMCNAFVLKGGSCATPSRHARPTYRNFFSPASRWQFTGIRLAKS